MTGEAANPAGAANSVGPANPVDPVGPINPAAPPSTPPPGAVADRRGEEEPTARNHSTLDHDLTCPSALARPGAILIGLSIGRRRLGYLSPPVEVDADFIAAAGTAPERRYRFANRCARGACHNWGEDSCRLIHTLISDRPATGPDGNDPLPLCGIRSTCRWFAQAGREACRVCPGVRHPGPRSAGTQPAHPARDDTPSPPDTVSTVDAESGPVLNPTPHQPIRPARSAPHDPTHTIPNKEDQ